MTKQTQRCPESWATSSYGVRAAGNRTGA